MQPRQIPDQPIAHGLPPMDYQGRPTNGQINVSLLFQKNFLTCIFDKNFSISMTRNLILSQIRVLTDFSNYRPYRKQARCTNQ